MKEYEHPEFIKRQFIRDREEESRGNELHRLQKIRLPDKELEKMRAEHSERMKNVSHDPMYSHPQKNKGGKK